MESGGEEVSQQSLSGAELNSSSIILQRVTRKGGRDAFDCAVESGMQGRGKTLLAAPQGTQSEISANMKEIQLFNGFACGPGLVPA